MKRTTVLPAAILVVALASTAPAQSGGGASEQVPKEKQTSLGLYLTAQEAYAKWQADPGQIHVLDVRTPEEYIYVGHAEMAWNIPLAVQTYTWDAARNHFALAPNPDFVAAARELLKPDDTILVMCRSGGRSAAAVNQLAQAGYRNVYNIVDGMEGDLVQDPASPDFGKRMKNGWKNTGLPWSYQVNPERVRLPTRTPAGP